MIDVLLIQVPPKEVVEIYDKPKYGNPNIGLAYIASFLRSKGKLCQVIDARYLGLTLDELKNQVKDVKTKVVGFSAMTHQIVNVAECAAELKLLDGLKDSLFVVGGCHATALPKETLEEFPVFDVVVVGEGEYATLEILDKLDKHLPIEPVMRKEFIENLDDLPFPAWDLFSSVKSYPIVASRGCPFQCIFCQRVLGNRVRKRDVRKVVEEVEWLVECFGMNHLRFMDETFTVDRKRVLEFCRLMIVKRLHKKVVWEVETRVDCVDEQMLKVMKHAGCVEVQFGVESGNQQVLDAIGKNIKIEQVVKAVMLAKKVGLRTTTFFIFGHPYETKESMKDTEKLAIKLNADTVVFGIMVPYPATVVAEMVKCGKGGYRLLSDSWNDFNKTVGNSVELDGVSRKQLENAQLMAYLRFYLYNFRFLGLFNLLRNNWRVVFYYFRKFI